MPRCFFKQLLLEGLAGFEGKEQFSFHAEAWQLLSVGDEEGFAFGFDELAAKTEACVDFGVIGKAREFCFVEAFLRSIHLRGGGKVQMLAGEGQQFVQALSHVLQLCFQLGSFRKPRRSRQNAQGLFGTAFRRGGGDVLEAEGGEEDLLFEGIGQSFLREEPMQA